jgi:DNA-binding NarL/FixJ family response regulator
MNIQLLFADDHSLIRESVKTLLETDKRIHCVHLAENGEEALEKVKQNKYDVIILDIQMPKCNGINALQKIRIEQPEAKIILISTFLHKKNVQTAVQMGADGFLLKDINPHLFVESILLVNKGMIVYQNEVRSFMQTLPEPTAPTVQTMFGLTSRDIEYIRLLADGLTNKEIAQIKNTSEGTVKNRVSSILQKLSLDARVQIAIFAVKNNLHLSN